MHCSNSRQFWLQESSGRALVRLKLLKTVLQERS
jgi:hypothetical protein